ncbi:MAG: S8 family peptidase [Gaiellales bacterium]
MTTERGVSVVLHAGDEASRPAHGVGGEAARDLPGARVWPARVDREWALGGSTGAGVTVCIVDSGVDAGHPRVGDLKQAMAVSIEDGQAVIEPDELGDVCGHGTACAGIVRSLAPECEIVSMRVLGEGFIGSGPALIEGLRWAVMQGFDVINMSLSTTKERFIGDLHSLADAAYFRRSLIVASAHNMPVRSYPWRFASVVSVASHDLGDPMVYLRNPDPPVEFYAHGIDVDVAWSGGSTLTASGNSFATPHISGICALMRSKHPQLTPPEVKTLLGLTAANAEAAR